MLTNSKQNLEKSIQKNQDKEFLQCLPLQIYREIAFAVPIPQGISDLPPTIFFDISKQFTPDQVQKIQDTIKGVLFNWSLHLTQKWNNGFNNGVSQLADCTNTYAVKNLQPLRYFGVNVTDGKQATDLAMEQLTEVIKDNGLRRSQRARIDWIYTPSPITIQLPPTVTKTQTPLSMIVNVYQLQQPNVTAGLLIGSMFHAWLHRGGYGDPKVTNYFISECPMCVMRSYQPKKPNVPDSLFYKYFN
ncbi:hypothetical protein [Priestia megaterium]|uniref:hypothetical protein n=1 Tax=Priestia megaterium TaxID=1404 RepID=UPI0012B7AC33|nr:hypothetical protein [Priestia megaterium]